jgi:hypothetical protein
MPYPEEKDFFDLYCPDTELGSMGPGFPLFFIFMRYLMWYLLLITCVYFLPISFLISEALSDFDGEFEGEDSMIALFSYGSFLHRAG